MNPRNPSDVRFFPVPTPNTGLLQIRVGPDGNLWFNEGFTSKIARITTAGVITEFPTPTPNNNPRDITFGPDGAVWFTELGIPPNVPAPPNGTPKIARMLPHAPYTITEFPVPSVTSATALPVNITLAADGNLWFTNDPHGGPGQIGRILSHAPYTITEFPLPPGNVDGSTDIISGPDHNLWFTEDTSIGRISPLGSDAAIQASMTAFPVSPATGLYNLTRGSDGNIWFTDQYGNAVGRILTKAPNTVTVFPAPTGAHPAFGRQVFVNGPVGITTGSDGNVWVTEAFAGKIGRFDLRRGAFDDLPTGLPDLSGLTQLAFGGPFVRERPIQTPTTDPAMVVTDSQGNEWFTESAANKIARVDHRTHAQTEFPIPTAGTNPFGLTLGHDGNIWFAEQGQLNAPGGAPTGNIGRILTTAPYTITEFPLGAGSGANGYITSGVDGNLWFGEVQLTGTTFSYTIDRMSPTTPNTVTKFHTKTPGAIPLGFTSGSDGGIWYPVRLTALGLSAIARIDPNAPDPQQSILEFLLPPSAEVAADITPGPNGTIWWTQASGTTSSIGRILTATSHTITQFPVPPTDVTGSSDATGITQGPDNNMWFTDKDPSKIGKILTGAANTITEYRTPTRFSGPRGITTGPDGSLVFTELGANKIGCVKLNPHTIPLLGDLFRSCE